MRLSGTLARGALTAAIILTLAIAGTARATPPAGGPPGQGECDHGNSQQTCKPDPQPSHGADCDEHGNHGGVNEDHCTDPEVTPSPAPSAEPSVEPSAEPSAEPSPTVDPTPTPSSQPTPTPRPSPTVGTPPSPPTPPAPRASTRPDPAPSIPATDTE